MNIIPLFASPIGWDFLDINNEALAEYCYSLEETSKDYRTQLGWQSNLIDMQAEALAPLIAEIQIKLLDASNLFPVLPEHEPTISTGWVNVNKPDGLPLQNNIQHLHPGRFWTFVYYVKAEENCGNLDLYSPMRNMLGYAIPNQVYSRLTPFNSLQWSVTPAAGKLIMFPGWIEHKAHENRSSSDRISIAINTDLQNLSKIQHPT
jgi:uncharacterized protein (TIGR02466 family)